MRKLKLQDTNESVLQKSDLYVNKGTNFGSTRKKDIILYPREGGSFKGEAWNLGPESVSYVPEVVLDEKGFYCLIFLKKG